MEKEKSGRLIFLIGMAVVLGLIIIGAILWFAVFVPYRQKSNAVPVRAMIKSESPINTDYYEFTYQPGKGNHVVIFVGVCGALASDEKLEFAVAKRLDTDDRLKDEIATTLMLSRPKWFEEASKYNANIEIRSMYRSHELIANITPLYYKMFLMEKQNILSRIETEEKEDYALLDTIARTQKAHMGEGLSAIGLPPMPKGVTLKDVVASESTLTYEFEIDESKTTPLEINDDFHWAGNRLGGLFTENLLPENSIWWLPLSVGAEIRFRAKGSRTGYVMEHIVLTHEEAVMSKMRYRYLKE